MKTNQDQENQARDFVVIGAGPAGLTAAYELTKRQISPIVIEKSDIVGGLACTQEYKGFRFDMGGHRFFTKSKAVNQIWREVLAHEFITRPRLSRIYYQRKFFNYPLKPFNALTGLGPVQSLLIGASYLKWSLFPYKTEVTFEEWVTNRFGKRLFETFFKAYTEKVWGISCKELKAEWAAQRIKDLSLKVALISMIKSPGTTVKTLIESFEYPRLGPGMMWETMRQKVEQAGGTVYMQSEIAKIRRNGHRILAVTVRRRDGQEQCIPGADFISSMPVTEFIQRLDPPAPPEIRAASRKLKYRDFLTVCLIVNQPDLFPDNWIYIHDPEVKVGRIQNFKNWSPEMVPDQSKTSLGLEYFCTEGDELWSMSDSELIELGKQEIDRIGLASAADVEDGCVFRVPKSYPIYDSDYGDYLHVVKDFVGQFDNFQTIGRNGLHRYNNQDHAMLTGILAVRNAVEGETNDLWSVNAEQEYHEEIREERDVPLVTEVVQDALARIFAKLDPVAFGLSAGLAFGLILLIGTLVLVLKGGEIVGPNLVLLSHYFPGYRVTPLGSLVALSYGMVSGFLAGWLLAFVRNSAVFLYSAITYRGAEFRALRRLLDYIH
ncbi:MAG: NAD(P)/FAD-dependent oxidoreductase [Acidobacteriota bacterium]